ncbi:MAG: hypothetical protein IKU45_00515 [Clostridia bacterium]|nr:hypothetical protein [Clostridia bacterium]
MRNRRSIILSIIWLVLGIGVITATYVAKLDAFWSGLGSAFICVSVLQLVRWGRYSRDAEYRERVETEAKDERNRYIGAKAWAWAGYLYVILAGIGCIVLRIFGYEILSLAASGSICIILALYWISYLVLRKKY